MKIIKNINLNQKIIRKERTRETHSKKNHIVFVDGRFGVQSEYFLFLHSHTIQTGERKKIIRSVDNVCDCSAIGAVFDSRRWL